MKKASFDFYVLIPFKRKVSNLKYRVDVLNVSNLAQPLFKHAISNSVAHVNTLLALQIRLRKEGRAVSGNSISRYITASSFGFILLPI